MIEQFPGPGGTSAAPEACSPVDNFANHPMTIGDLRSEKSGKAYDWSVRDLLIHMLRNIDSGGDMASATHVVVCLGKVDAKGCTNVYAMQAGTKNTWEGIGILHQTLKSLVADY